MKANRLIKGAKARQHVYLVKLNKVDKTKDDQDPLWLQEFSDIFPEELTNLPPSREVDHDIETFSGCKPVNKRLYKMSLPQAIELK